MAEAAGDDTPDSVQNFSARIRWDRDAVCDDLRAYVVERLGDRDAVLVLNETGFLKKGDKVGEVECQYPGDAGASRIVRLACISPSPAGMAVP